MDITTAGKAMKLVLRLIDRHTPTGAVIPFKPQKPAWTPSEAFRPLPRATPESLGVSSARVADFLDAVEGEPSCGLHGCIVLKDGCVVAERAAAPYRNEVWHATYSLCKSFTGTAIGLLTDDGRLSLDDSVVKLLERHATPLAKLRLRGLTVRHLLTMSSGILFNEAGGVTEEDWVHCFMDSGTRFEPGTSFAYNSMNTYMLSAIVREVTGRSLSGFLGERLFAPLGFDGVFWETCPRGVEKGGWGMYLRLEDMAKLGQLYLQNGVWEGERILSETWCREAMSEHMGAPKELGGYGYGYQMWIGRGVRSALFNGMFGQNVLVLPDTGTVVAVTAGNSDLFQTNALFGFLDRYFGGDYRPGAPLPPDKAAFARLGGVREGGGFSKLTTSMLAALGGVRRSTPERVRAGRARPDAGRSAFPRFLRARGAPSLPEPCALLAGRRYTVPPGTAGGIGLLPLCAQSTQNNYTEGLTAISFAVTDGEFLVDVTEGATVRRLQVGFGAAREVTLDFGGEPYLAAVTGRFAENEDGEPVLVLRVDFLELPNSRIIKLYYGGKALRVRWNESPGADFVLGLFALGKEMIKDTPVIGALAGKVADDRLELRIRDGFEPWLTLTREPDPNG